MTTEFPAGIFVGALLGTCVGDDVGCFVVGAGVGCVVVGAGVDMNAGLDRRHSSLSSHGAHSHCLYGVKRLASQIRT